jgi:hypothetical protein
MPAALLTMFLKNALVTKEIIASGITDGYRLLSPVSDHGSASTKRFWFPRTSATPPSPPPSTA